MRVEPLTLVVVNDALMGVVEPMAAAIRRSPMISTGD